MKNLFFLAILVSFVSLNKGFKSPEKWKKIDSETICINFGKYTLDESWKIAVRGREGFSDTAYYCAAGYLTIGYGCVIDTEFERDFIGKKISEKDAANIVYNYVYDGVGFIDSLSNGKFLLNQKIALSLFFACTDRDAFFSKYPDQLQRIKDGLPIRFTLWETFCGYRDKDGNLVKNNWMKISRRYEIALFKGNVKEVEALTFLYSKNLQKK